MTLWFKAFDRFGLKSLSNPGQLTVFVACSGNLLLWSSSEIKCEMLTLDHVDHTGNNDVMKV